MQNAKWARGKMIVTAVVSLVIVAVVGLVAFELTVDDVKGAENPIKQAAYQAARIAPIKASVRLAVPYHRQQHRLSCEVASLLMALKYRGVKVTENELIKRLPVSDPGPRTADNVWGDPNKGFVGNIDGRMPNGGYGVYERPIYDLAAEYRNAKILTGVGLNDLIAELDGGNPIVVWGVIGSGKDISWKTPDGKTISAKMDEHARVLIGYTGDSKNPKLMILLDPIYGEIRMSVKNFLANWAKLDTRAVVVY